MIAMFSGQPVLGPKGENGVTFTPSVSESGDLSWTNDKGLPNPEPVNIKGPQGEDASSVYSTEETRIGTWIDGKPLYRKVMNCVIGAPWGRVADFDNTKYTAHKFSCMAYNRVPNTYYSSATDFFTCYISASDGILCYYATEKTFRGKKLEIIVEYTKTTDVAPAAQTSLFTSQSMKSEAIPEETVLASEPLIQSMEGISAETTINESAGSSGKV